MEVCIYSNTELILSALLQYFNINRHYLLLQLHIFKDADGYIVKTNKKTTHNLIARLREILLLWFHKRAKAENYASSLSTLSIKASGFFFSSRKRCRWLIHVMKVGNWRRLQKPKADAGSTRYRHVHMFTVDKCVKICLIKNQVGSS